ncbi:hypothetical protein QZH44_29760 (plasmid) [Pseudomonas corrugata]|uniref:hypothetical protein n=1 Tax=Pseudomonas corrugata TaxID=47879 RepID=UPI003D81861C
MDDIDLYPSHSSPGKGLCGDCRDGVYIPKNTPSPLPNPNATPAKSQQELELDAKQAFDDAAVLYVRKIRLDEEPLENESMVVKWLIDRLKNKVLPTGPWGTVLDSLEPTVGDISEFDKIKDKDEMKRLRSELDAEERQLRRDREQNAKLYEENMKHLEPKLAPEDRSRALASLPELNKMQEALVARAQLRSEDYGYVVQQVLTRTRFDADIRMPAATYKKVAEALWRTTPSNVCVVPTIPSTSCVLYGIRKDQPCTCPNIPNGSFAFTSGKTSRAPLGSVCRSNELSADFRQLFPVGVQCSLPVNVSPNPNFPRWEYLLGVIKER